MIEDVLAGRKRLPEVIASRSKGRKRPKAFTVPPAVTISNSLSNAFTVIEIECLDRTVSCPKSRPCSPISRSTFARPISPPSAKR